jgi:hypothetical protein
MHESRKLLFSVDVVIWCLGLQKWDYLLFINAVFIAHNLFLTTYIIVASCYGDFSPYSLFDMQCYLGFSLNVAMSFPSFVCCVWVDT